MNRTTLKLPGRCFITAAATSMFIAACGTQDIHHLEKHLIERNKPTHKQHYATTIPDFSSHGDVGEKKKRFFKFLRPVVEAENARIMAQRERLLQLHEKYRSGNELNLEECQWLEDISSEYEMETLAIHHENWWKSLKESVDIIPTPLVLVQAAIESGWGTSRFAREGNNMFGQWCFNKKRGMVPRRRETGSNHLVAKFTSVNQSVRSYMRNLNTNNAYREFRNLRGRQRREGKLSHGYHLAHSLHKYSERRGEYVQKLRMIMRVNSKLLNITIPVTVDYCQAGSVAENVTDAGREAPVAGTSD
jgi:Bax protein